MIFLFWILKLTKVRKYNIQPFISLKNWFSVKEGFGVAKDMLFLNTNAAYPSASLKAFNNYFYYQDKLKNMFSFPTKTFSVYIAVF